MKQLVLGSLAPLTLLALACGACGGAAPNATGGRPSGQSSLIEGTLAGASSCSSKTHQRPFVIEWDATDMSSFESKASSDVVFVKYEGCDLVVLDGCASDVRGALGAYGAVDWTSGSVEKIDIANQGELYAKLPLGAATLGGRVSQGEQFHMEYYVSGTRKATRDEVYRSELDAVPRCKGATHFVYAYNLGAFALASAKQLTREAGATVWGIGAGGKSSSLGNADKRGGVLTSCTGVTAKETQTCTVPIRLTLREISGGANPDVVASRAPETPDAMNLAGKVMQKMEANEQAKARAQAAVGKMNAGDGKGCLKELDAMDRVEPAHVSTNPKSPSSFARGMCVMLAGQCDAGRAQLRKAYQAQTDLSTELVDASVDAAASKHCAMSTLAPDKQLLKAAQDLGIAATMQKKDAEYCTRTFETVRRLAPTVKADPADTALSNAQNIGFQRSAYASCLGRAGDCPASFAAFRTAQSESGFTPSVPGVVRSEADERASFANIVTTCKAWASSQKASPRDDLVRASKELERGRVVKTDAASCKKNHAAAIAAAASVDVTQAADPVAFEAKDPMKLALSAALCLGKAGDCAAGARALEDAIRAAPGGSTNRAAEPSLRGMFAGITGCGR